MKVTNIITCILITALFLTGIKLVMDGISLKNSYSETFQYVMDPIETIIENPSQSLNSLDPDEYLEVSTNKILDTTSEAIKYRRSLITGISCIIGGLIALIFRENINTRLFNFFKFFF